MIKELKHKGTLFVLLNVLLWNFNSVFSQSVNEKILKIEYNFDETETLKMSEIISEISYIPLETNTNCLLGYMWIYVFGKDILIKSNDSNESILRFSSQGKFLNKIGNKGHGPGEYHGCSDMFIKGDTVCVVSNFTNSIIYYRLSGEYIKSYKLNIDNRPKHIVQLPDNSFIISLSNESDLGNIIKTDKDFRIQTGFFKNLTMNRSSTPNRFQKSRGKVLYFRPYDNNIYEISSGIPVPSITIDYGKFKTSNRKLSVDAKRNVILNKPQIYDFDASDDYYKMIFYYPYKQSSYAELYRIKDGKEMRWSKLINDVDGGIIDKWFGILVGDNLIFHLMPFTIINRYQEMTEEEKRCDANLGFVDMASKLTPNSNPVIMICKLK